MTTRRQQPKRAAGALALSLFVAVVATACGASGGGGPAATSAPPSAGASTVPSAPTTGASTVPTTSASGATSTSPTRPTGTTSPTGRASAPQASPGTPSAVGSGATQPVRPVKTKKSVPLDDPAEFGTGLTVRLTDIKAVKAVAQAPGEIAGPALRITVEARNRSSATIPVDRFTVFVTYGKARTPASGLSQGTKPLAGSVRARSSQDGTYVFAVPADEREQVRVEVSYSGKAPTLAFEGSVD
jgi:hypothetical protein